MKNQPKSLKKVFIGFALSIGATIAGCYIILDQILEGGLEVTWSRMIEEHLQSSVLSLGAIPNLLLFFVFIKRHEDQKAKGVLMGVILIAVLAVIFKFF